MIVYNEENHYATNIGVVITQIYTDGGINHLEVLDSILIICTTG